MLKCWKKCWIAENFRDPFFWPLMGVRGSREVGNRYSVCSRDFPGKSGFWNSRFPGFLWPGSGKYCSTIKTTFWVFLPSFSPEFISRLCVLKDFCFNQPGNFLARFGYDCFAHYSWWTYGLHFWLCKVAGLTGPIGHYSQWKQLW